MAIELSFNSKSYQIADIVMMLTTVMNVLSVHTAHDISTSREPASIYLRVYDDMLGQDVPRRTH